MQDHEATSPCVGCGGTGKTTSQVRAFSKCVNCHGTGLSVNVAGDDIAVCEKCSGNGKVLRIHRVEAACEMCRDVSVVVEPQSKFSCSDNLREADDQRVEYVDQTRLTKRQEIAAMVLASERNRPSLDFVERSADLVKTAIWWADELLRQTEPTKEEQPSRISERFEVAAAVKNEIIADAKIEVLAPIKSALDCEFPEWTKVDDEAISDIDCIVAAIRRLASMAELCNEIEPANTRVSRPLEPSESSKEFMEKCCSNSEFRQNARRNGQKTLEIVSNLLRRGLSGEDADEATFLADLDRDMDKEVDSRIAPIKDALDLAFPDWKQAAAPQANDVDSIVAAIGLLANHSGREMTHPSERPSIRQSPTPPPPPPSTSNFTLPSGRKAWDVADSDYGSPVDVVEAGVDPSHQTDHCDHCGVMSDALGDDLQFVRTTSHTGPLTLCPRCYSKASSSVR